VVASDLLRHGIPAGRVGHIGRHLCAGERRHGLLATVCRRSPLVVEVVRQLRECRRVSIRLRTLVPGQPNGSGWILARCNLLDVHVHDQSVLWAVLWECGIPVRLLVQQADLRCAQGGLMKKWE
jgi:hypothetical protein